MDTKRKTVILMQVLANLHQTEMTLKDLDVDTSKLKTATNYVFEQVIKTRAEIYDFKPKPTYNKKK